MNELIMFVLALMALQRSGVLTSPGWTSPASNAEDAQAKADRARREAEQATKDAEAARRASQAPKAWPVAAPNDLPPFPSGWEYSDPPSAAVRARAWQLLDQLWKQGQGSTSVELTAGSWITYRAEITKGNKRGVVAYRPKRGARPAAPKQPTGAPKQRTATAPPVVTSPGIPQKVSTPAPAAPGSAPPALRTTEAGKPWLHRGAGLGALVALAPYVRDAQQKLAALKFYTGKIDGQFGPKMFAGVQAFQKARALQVDGVIGDNTWAALDSAAPLTAWNVQVGPATALPS